MVTKYAAIDLASNMGHEGGGSTQSLKQCPFSRGYVHSVRYQYKVHSCAVPSFPGSSTQLGEQPGMGLGMGLDSLSGEGLVTQGWLGLHAGVILHVPFLRMHHLYVT